MTIEVRPPPVAADLLGDSRFLDALAPLRMAISQGDIDPVTQLNLAIAEDRAGDRDRARRLMGQVAVRFPEWDEPLLRLAESFRAAVEYQQAEEAYQQVLALSPNRPEPLIALAGLLLMRREYATAHDLLIRACGIDPKNPEVWSALGLALRGRGDFGRALSAFVRAQALRPDCVDYVLQGVDVTLAADAGEAELARLAVACERNPLNPALQAGRGVLLERVGRISDAIEALEVAVELSPDALALLRLLGQMLARSARVKQAEGVLRRLTALDPDDLEISNAHAVVLMRMSRFSEARSILQDVLQRHGRNRSVLCNLANATVYSGAQDEALAIAREAIEMDPIALQPRRALATVLSYHSAANGKDLLDAMRSCSDALARTAQPPLSNDADPERPLVVGLLSGTLRTHPVGWLTVAAIEALDRDAFSVVCLAQSAIPDDTIARRFRTAAQRWVDIDHISDVGLAGVSRGLGIDILIDLGGYGDAARMTACANRLAPVQIKWVGMQSHSSGLAEMDWILTDRWETPDGFERFYSEKLLRLPDGYVCYSPPPHAPDVVALPALANGFVTFGCFNNLAKITPQAIETWATILHRVPDARLILKTHQFSDAATADGVRADFAALGITDDRLDFRGSSGHRAFMGQYGDVDIVLDPFPYSGGLTTCEALWMGVPTITLPGEIFASRHSASHLSNAGLADWVTGSLAEYIDMAVARAADLPALAALRAGLREKVRRSPLCDATRFGRGLGAALRHTWRTWCQEQKSSIAPAADT